MDSKVTLSTVATRYNEVRVRELTEEKTGDASVMEVVHGAPFSKTTPS